MDMFHDGASRQRLKILPKLAFHGSAGLAAILCAGVAGYFMMDSGTPQPVAAPATAQIYEVPDVDATEVTSAIANVPVVDDTPEAAPQPVAEAPIPPKPVAKPVIKAAARSCDGGDCESWETIVNKALTSGPAVQSRPAPVRTSVPNERPRFDAPNDDIMVQDLMAQNQPRVIQPEGPTSIGEMAKSATTSAAATVVTQSSKLVDNLMRWSETAVSGVGIRRDHTPPEPLPY
jgi:hypothetical protein